MGILARICYKMIIYDLLCSDYVSSYAAYKDNINLDSITHGIFWINTYNVSSISGNIPFTNDHVMLIATGNIKEDTLLQCALSLNTNTFKIRYKAAGTWVNWS